MRARTLIVAAVLFGAVLVAAGMLLGMDPTPDRSLETTVLPAAGSGEIFAAAPVPTAVPELRFVDGDGRPRSLAEFRGKVVLLNLWATWCVPCRKEMPAIDRLQAQLGGPAFTVVPLSVDRKGLPVVRAFYAELGLRALAIYVDESGAALRQVNALGLPTTLLVDAEGRELGRAVGAREWDSEAVVAEIQRHLGPASSGPKAQADPSPSL